MQEQEECIRETRVLSSLDSDFIIKYYDSFLERVCAEYKWGVEGAEGVRGV